jgi:hypothetical protein
MTRNLIQKAITASVIILSCSGLNIISAQSTPQEIMAQIYKKYDSLNFITFDVKYVYSTDTLNGDFNKEVLNGSYTMAGKRAKYRIGDIEFMQNDSFFISVYTKDKFILVADPHTNNTGSELPMRPLMDSLIKSYGKHYTIHTKADTVLGTMTFERADSLAQFDKFLISYDVKSHFLNAIQYDFRESQVINPDDTTNQPQIALRKKSLTVEISNYRIDNFSNDTYNENNYIWFEDGECKPVDRYRDFKIYYSRTGFKTIRNN